jgi:hypothetical protein
MATCYATGLAPLTLSLVALAAGFAWGSYHRERRNQHEWRDYQAFLRQRRARPRFEADRWGVSSGPPVVSPE